MDPHQLKTTGFRVEVRSISGDVDLTQELIQAALSRPNPLLPPTAQAQIEQIRSHRLETCPTELRFDISEILTFAQQLPPLATMVLQKVLIVINKFKTCEALFEAIEEVGSSGEAPETAEEIFTNLGNSSSSAGFGFSLASIEPSNSEEKGTKQSEILIDQVPALKQSAELGSRIVRGIIHLEDAKLRNEVIDDCLKIIALGRHIIISEDTINADPERK